MKPAILTLVLLCPLVLVGCNSKRQLTSDGQHEIVMSDRYMELRPVSQNSTPGATGLMRHFGSPTPESSHNQFTCPTCGLFRVD